MEVDDARRVVLDIPEGAQPAPDAPAGTPDPTPAQDAEVTALRAQLAAVESERDHLRATVDKLAGTVDRLTLSLAQLTGTVVEQRALDTGIDTLKWTPLLRSPYGARGGHSGGNEECLRSAETITMRYRHGYV